MQNRLSMMVEKDKFPYCFTDEFSRDAYIVLPVVHADLAVCMRNSFDERKDVIVVRLHFQRVLFE